MNLVNEVAAIRITIISRPKVNKMATQNIQRQLTMRKASKQFENVVESRLKALKSFSVQFSLAKGN